MSFETHLKNAENLTSDLEAMKQKIENEMTEKANGILGPLFKTFLEKYPLVRGFKWNQYTDYFNDGETCTFGIHGIGFGFEPELVIGPGDYYTEYPERAGQWNKEDLGGASTEDWSHCSGYDLEDQTSGWNNEFPKEFLEDWKKIQSTIHSLEDLLKFSYGDHVSIIVTREGIEKQEYTDHD